MIKILKLSSTLVGICLFFVTHSSIANSSIAAKLGPIISILLLDGEEEVTEVIEPTVFKLVEANSTHKDIVQVSWLPAVDPETALADMQYTVHVGTSRLFNLTDSVQSKSVTGLDSTTVTNLSPSTQYYVKVVAANKDGEESWSNEIGFSTLQKDNKISSTSVVRNIDASLEGVEVLDGVVTIPNVSNTNEVGDVIVSADENQPFLRRVVNVNTLNNQTTIQTEPVGLVELFDDFEINTTINLNDIEPIDSSSQIKQKKSLISNVKPKVAEKKWITGLTLSSTDTTKKVKYAAHKAKESRLKVRKSESSDKPLSELQISNSARYLSASINEYLSIKVGETLRQKISLDVHNVECVARFWDSSCDYGDYVKPKTCGIEVESIKSPKGLSDPVNFPTINTISGNNFLEWSPSVDDLGQGNDPYLIDIVIYEGTVEEDCDNTSKIKLKEIKVFIEKGEPNIDLNNELFTFSGGFDIDNQITSTFEPELVVQAKKGSGASLESAEISLNGVFNLKQELTAKATAAAILNSGSQEILNKGFVKVINAGPVPILVRGDLTVALGMEATAYGEMNLTETFENNLDITIGAEYLNGEWSSLNNVKNTYAVKLEGDAEAGLDATAYVDVSLTLTFYEAVSGNLIASPYVFGETEVQGSFNYLNEDGSPSTDLNYSLTKLNAGYGVDVFLYLGLDIFDVNIASFPSDGVQGQKETYEKFTPASKTDVLQLPELRLSVDPTASLASNSQALRLVGSYENFPNPLTSEMGDSIISFSNWTDSPTVVTTSSECEGTFVSSEDENSTWFIPSKFGACHFRYAGVSDLGRYARQTVDTVYNITDSDNNNVPDYWQARYNLSDMALDSDNDGINNAAEFIYATNPIEPDTDGDGVKDGVEVDFQSDPNDPESKPNISTISISDITQEEGDAGSTSVINFGISLDQFIGAVEVDYRTLDGAATTSDNDYIGKTGTLSFLGGNTSQVVSITILGDDVVEQDEVFTLVLSNPRGAVFAGGLDEAVATIVNDDSVLLSPLNDTGITFGGNYPSGNNTGCSGEVISQQDCSHGRDATHNDDSDGHAGFSFTKLSSTGTELAANASQWSCVRDNVTGLIWEKKTDDATEHDKDNTYRWGGLTAQGRDHPSREGDYYDDWNALVNFANNNGLCGYSDWRVPTYKELYSIVDYGSLNQAIDMVYFPNTTSSQYWTSSREFSFLSAWVVGFSIGYSGIYSRDYPRKVRLVR